MGLQTPLNLPYLSKLPKEPEHLLNLTNNPRDPVHFPLFIKYPRDPVHFPLLTKKLNNCTGVRSYPVNLKPVEETIARRMYPLMSTTFQDYSLELEKLGDLDSLDNLDNLDNLD